MPPKIISIIGARPQFIKHAPVALALDKKFNSVSVHTGQHYDENMSSVFFNELKIPRPDYLLDLGKAGSHAAQTAAILVQVEELLVVEKPDAVLVYGDTNSTLSGALAAAKLNIPIIHIEAGLRSFNREMPEEINRVMADHLSFLLFAPTQTAVENLENEGIRTNVFLTGDVMCDSLTMMKPFLQKKVDEPYYFVTLHRPYNTDDKSRLQHIFSSFQQLNKKVVFPIHPRTANNARKWNIDLDAYSNIDFVDPVGYGDCLSLQAFSDCVITDSGGIQKEAYMLQKQCITLRTETEWVETLENGCNTLVFHNLDIIKDILAKPPVNGFSSIYGDGKAAEEIVAIIENNLP